MSNPLDNRNAVYFVLVNDQGQHSLWPDIVPLPSDWSIAFGSANHESCLGFIERLWAERNERTR